MVKTMDVNTVIASLSSIDKEYLKKNPHIWSIIALKKIVKTRIVIGGSSIEHPIRFYIGVKRDHVIIPRVFCSCKDFIIHVMSEKKRRYCIHLLAERVLEDKKYYRSITIDINTLHKIINEIMMFDRSPTLRRILYKNSTRNSQCKSRNILGEHHGETEEEV